MSLLPNPLGWLPGRTLRIGVTGLARAGKTTFLTSVAANLLAQGAGRTALPALAERFAGRRLGIRLASSAAADIPRFNHAQHLAQLAADPPAWPRPTNQVALLAFDLSLEQALLGVPLPAQRLRLELLDYPGEWLLDLPLLRLDYAAWSQQALARLEQPAAAPIAREFLAFAAAIPARAGRDEDLARIGHSLYATMLARLRDEAGLSLLQPGRFLMPPPGHPPPWMTFFPVRSAGGLASLMSERYLRYVQEIQSDLASPLFGDLDRLVVLVDLLTALGRGAASFADAADALAMAAGALRWRRSWSDVALALGHFRLPPRTIGRVAFVATKADHVAAGQRNNLAALTRAITLGDAGAGVATAHMPVAAVRCTSETTWLLDGRAVSAVEGRMQGKGRVRSYPGEVPAAPPGPEFWAHPFFALPEFEPPRLAEAGRAGVPHLNLDALLAFLLEDVA